MKLSLIRLTLIIVSLASFLLTAGCGSGGGNAVTPIQPGTAVVGPPFILKNSEFADSIINQVNDILAQNPSNADDWTKFLHYFGDIVGHGAYDVELRKMLYISRRADGSQVQLSGLLILPRGAGGTKPAVPIMMYQHGTEPYRVNAPSQFLVLGHNPFDYPEVIIAISMAMTGYAVALPDYEGMGDNTDIQPFVHAQALANQVIDMTRATRNTMSGLVGIVPPCSWNGKLFLMGYSEGGFVTMAATREMQLNHAGEFTVTASAPMAGPHDLSGTMREVILADTTFKAPYFVPFVLTAYYSIYQDSRLSPDYTLISPFNATLPPLLNGNYTGEAINMAMGMTYDPVHLIVAKSVLTQQFITDLGSTTSAIYGYLQQNDTYRGWAPNMPVRMFHNPADDLVPFANSQVAFNAFSSAGAKKWVTLVASPDTVYLTNSTVPTVHVAAAVPEIHDAWQWIYTNF
ncbi:MAG TPA: lipase family protein [Geobacteraceae bacterium]|nr:lipase family protein [Geobacteraceae bacterium]